MQIQWRDCHSDHIITIVVIIINNNKKNNSKKNEATAHPGAETLQSTQGSLFWKVPHLQFQSLKTSLSRLNLLNIITHPDFWFWRFHISL